MVWQLIIDRYARRHIADVGNRLDDGVGCRIDREMLPSAVLATAARFNIGSIAIADGLAPTAILALGAVGIDADSASLQDSLRKSTAGSLRYLDLEPTIGYNPAVATPFGGVGTIN